MYLMEVKGHFRANIQLGPVTVRNVDLTVAKTIGNGLLGCDVLEAVR